MPSGPRMPSPFTITAGPRVPVASTRSGSLRPGSGRFDQLVTSLAERQIQTGEDRKLGPPVAVVCNGPLGFDERIHDGRTGFPCLAGTEADRDVVVGVPQIESPDGSGA